MLYKNIQTLKNKKEFDFVYKNSVRFRSEVCDICILRAKLMDNFYIRFNKSIDYNLVGFIVSKKVGKAVERNLIKRRFRAIIQKLLSQKTKFVFIIIAKEKINQIPFYKLEVDIKNTLFKAV